MTQSYPIATIGTEDGFTDETFLSQSSSTGMSASEMLATEVFTPEMSATEMSTTETSAAKMSPTRCQLIKILNLGYSLLKCLPMNSYYWACTKKCFTENCAIDLPATNMFTKRLKDLSLKCPPLKYSPLKCPPLNCYCLVTVIIY